jgi:hypothetical protein
VRRQLLPPAEARRQQAEHGGRAGARGRAARMFGVLARYLRSLWRASRGAPALR